MNKLSGKVVLVTGAASGIGRDVAVRMGKLGADIGIIDIDFQSYKNHSIKYESPRYGSINKELKKLGVNYHSVEADVSDQDQVNRAVSEIANKIGDIDILVANAGGGTGHANENPASKVDLEELKIVLARNFYGTVHCCKAVIPFMKKKGYGKIVTVASVSGLQSNDWGTYSHYAASKAAIISYTKHLAQELGRYNITANAIAPGYIQTPRTMEKLFKYGGLETYKSRTALKRFGTTEDVANVVEFLTTNLSDYVTGSVLDVTGGLIK